MVTGLGFRLSGLRFGLRDLGFKAVGLWVGFGVWRLGFKAWNS